MADIHRLDNRSIVIRLKHFLVPKFIKWHGSECMPTLSLQVGYVVAGTSRTLGAGCVSSSVCAAQGMCRTRVQFLHGFFYIFTFSILTMFLICFVPSPLNRVTWSHYGIACVITITVKCLP